MKKIISILVFCVIASTSLFAQVRQEGELVDQYGVKVNTEEINTTIQNGILVFKSNDSDYKLWLDARVNLDGAAFFGPGEKLEPIGNGVSVRRARFAVKAQILKNWYGEVDMDMADGAFELKDAIIRYDGIKNLQIQMGNFKEFLLTQRNTSSRNLTLIERPMMASALTPSRSIGINFKYSIPLIWASAGYFFQEVKGIEELELVQDNNKDMGINPGSSINAKLAIRPINKLHSGLAFSGAYSYRTPKSSSSLYDYEEEEYEYGFRYSTRATTSINRKKYLDTNGIPGENEQIYNGEILAYHNGFRFEAAYQGVTVKVDGDRKQEINDFIADEEYDGDHDEAFEDSNDYLAFDNSNKTFYGYYAQASYLLFGGKNRYDAGGHKMTRPTRGKDWGDIELVARYDYLNLNTGFTTNDIMGGSASAYTFGINYYINRQVKLMVNYQYTDNDEYANGKKGKWDSGYDSEGEGVKGFKMERRGDEMTDRCGIDFSAVSFRIQIAF